ncbi:hypothetical protein ABMA09_18730 [Erwinia rhapontici]
MIRVSYVLTKRIEFPGIGVGPLFDKKYISLFEANLPQVGEVVSIQYGEDQGQSGSFVVKQINRSISASHEDYMVWVEGA